MPSLSVMGERTTHSPTVIDGRARPSETVRAGWARPSQTVIHRSRRPSEIVRDGRRCHLCPWWVRGRPIHRLWLMVEQSHQRSWVAERVTIRDLGTSECEAVSGATDDEGRQSEVMMDWRESRAKLIKMTHDYIRIKIDEREISHWLKLIKNQF